MKKLEADIPKHVSPVELCALFGVTPPTLTAWVADGMPKEKQGIYNLAECVRWRVDSLKKQIEQIRYTKDQSLTDLKKEYQQIQNRERLVKLAAMEGQLVPKTQALALWTEQIGVIVRALEALPAQVNDAIAGDNQTFEIIRRLINATRRDVAEQSLDLSRDIYSETGADSTLLDADQ